MHCAVARRADLVRVVGLVAGLLGSDAEASAASDEAALSPSLETEAARPSWIVNRFSGEVALRLHLRGAYYNEKGALNTGGRIGATQIGWFGARPYGIQAEAEAAFNYYSTLASDGNPDTMLITVSLRTLARLKAFLVGFAGGVEIVWGGQYGPPSRGGFGPALGIGVPTPTKNMNLRLLVDWRPVFGSLYDVNLDLKFDVGNFTVGGYFSCMERALILAPFASLSQRVVPTGGLTLGLRFPW